MRILIVGGAGYIGSRLVPALEARGHQVNVVDLCWFGNPTQPPFSEPILCEDAINLSTEDLCHFDAVVFLGGLSNDPMADFDPRLNYLSNGALPGYLAEIARRAGVKIFIHGGSCSVYGFSDFVTEDSPPATFSPYGVSKLMGEVGVLQQREHMRVVCFRMGTVAGWSSRMRFDLVVNAMVKTGITDETIYVNDSKTHRPILDIMDAVNGYVFALESPHVHGVINLSSENTTVSKIAQTVQGVLRQKGNASPRIELKGIPDIRSYSVSTVKATRLGFSFQGGVHRAASEVAMNFALIDDVEDPIYYNIKTFQAMQEDEVPISAIDIRDSVAQRVAPYCTAATVERATG